MSGIILQEELFREEDLCRLNQDAAVLREPMDLGKKITKLHRGEPLFDQIDSSNVNFAAIDCVFIFLSLSILLQIKYFL